MADSVPDNETFSLQNIIDVVGGGSLQECFDNAILAGFDGDYDDYVKGSTVRDSTYNFRNYHLTTGVVSAIVYAYYGPQSNPWSSNTWNWELGTNFLNVRDAGVGLVGPVDREYFECTTQITSGPVISTNIHRPYVRFDFTTIPPGSTIVSAQLRFPIYYGQYFGTEYSPANNYGQITLHPSSSWVNIDNYLYSQIKKHIVSDLFYSPFFNGSTSWFQPVYGGFPIKVVNAIASDFPILESYFGSTMYATFVTRQDRDIIAPASGQKLGVNIYAPRSDRDNPNRRLEIRIDIEYIP